MDAIAVLEILAVGIPLVAAVLIWLTGDKFPVVPRGLAAIALGITGLAALILFVVKGHFACMLASGPRNCLFDGMTTLALIVLSLVLARWTMVIRDAHLKGALGLALLLDCAWAGLDVSDNLLEFLLSLNLLFFVIYRLLRRNNIRWGIFVSWPDPRDHP